MNSNLDVIIVSKHLNIKTLPYTTSNKRSFDQCICRLPVARKIYCAHRYENMYVNGSYS